MHIALYSHHRYTNGRGQGTGLAPTTEPSGAANQVLDLLARGLAEAGYEIDYVLPAGIETPLPPGVRHLTEVPSKADIIHNVWMPGRPWVVTVHAHRPFAAYCRPRLNGGGPDAARASANGNGNGNGAQAYELPANAICVSRTLARSFGRDRFVHNGIDPGDYLFSESKGDYFLFMAGMQGEAVREMYRAKGLELVLSLSRELGFDLVVAGGARDRAIGDRVARLCHESGARYVGDVRGERKAELLSGARALLCPTRINEGFGLVMAEALMSGTPVISSDRGACPELISPDVGFVCPDRPAYAAAIAAASSISPVACRAKALSEFHYRRMTDDYVREYERELGGTARAIKPIRSSV